MWNFPNSRHVRNTSKNLTESRSNAREEQMASNSLANKIRNGKAAPMPCECRTTVFVMFMRRVYFEIVFDVFCFFPLVPHQWNIFNYFLLFVYMFGIAFGVSLLVLYSYATHAHHGQEQKSKKKTLEHTHTRNEKDEKRTEPVLGWIQNSFSSNYVPYLVNSHIYTETHKHTPSGTCAFLFRCLMRLSCSSFRVYISLRFCRTLVILCLCHAEEHSCIESISRLIGWKATNVRNQLAGI